MIDDDDPSDITPAATPFAKKSSSTWRLNLDGALCGREGCEHRRDAHTTHDAGSHRYECQVAGCTCTEFVIGGPDTERDFDRLADSSEPPPPEKK